MSLCDAASDLFPLTLKELCAGLFRVTLLVLKVLSTFNDDEFGSEALYLLLGS